MKNWCRQKRAGILAEVLVSSPLRAESVPKLQSCFKCV